MALLTLADYQAAVGSTANAAAQLMAIDDAIAAILAYTDRDFDSAPAVATRSYTYRGTGFLEIDDVTAITDVSSDFPLPWWHAHQDGPAAATVFTWLELPKYDASAWSSIGAMGFTRNLDTIIQSRGWVPEWTVSVTGTFGWATVPHDVRRAAIWLAQDFERSALDDSSGPLSSETVAEVSRSYTIIPPPQPTSVDDSALSAKVQGLLAPYRRHVL